ncbi:MAG: hypothetical protein QXT73_08420 [Candidatus Methanomethylicaceae archaeon]
MKESKLIYPCLSLAISPNDEPPFSLSPLFFNVETPPRARVPLSRDGSVYVPVFHTIHSEFLSSVSIGRTKKRKGPKLYQAVPNGGGLFDEVMMPKCLVLKVTYPSNKVTFFVEYGSLGQYLLAKHSSESETGALLTLGANKNLLVVSGQNQYAAQFAISVADPKAQVWEIGFALSTAEGDIKTGSIQLSSEFKIL